MLAEPGPQTFSWLKVLHRLAIVENGESFFSLANRTLAFYRTLKWAGLFFLALSDSIISGSEMNESAWEFFIWTTVACSGGKDWIEREGE